MKGSRDTDAASKIPEGYRAIPIHEKTGDMPLALCVLVRQTTDPVTGPFVLIQSLPAASVYLGCVVDAGGRVKDWLELWIQNLDGLAAAPAAYRENLSNHVLDERWQTQAAACRESDPEGYVHTGWESIHPRPVLIDTAKGCVVPPGDPAQGGLWELCRDDALLQAAGLPAYSTSLVRYLHQPGLGKQTRFVPVTAGALENSVTSSVDSVLASSPQVVPLNRQGGLMMVRVCSPVGFEEYVDLLGGQSWKGIEHGRKPFAFPAVYRALAEWEQAAQEQGYLFLGGHGWAGRFVETYHLKLQLLGEVVRLVRASVQKQQVPFLNLAADSFRVRIAPLGNGLPFLWSARCVLARPPAACALPVQTTTARYFIGADAALASIYQPAAGGVLTQGSGTVRIRKVLPPDREGVILEGTLVTQEKLPVSKHDLVWIQLPLACGRTDLYAHIYSEESLATGEARFRTVAQQLPSAVTAALQAAEGVAFPRAPFDVVPLLSSPGDLYAVAVLAVRTLLVNGDATLATALDEVLSLARQLATETGSTTNLPARIQSLFDKDPRWAVSLGPHRLSHDTVEPATAFKLIPAELWWDTLAWIVRLLPGAGPDSICRDFGDVPPLALESVFDQPLAELESLLLRSRSLVVIDWSFSREIRGIIQGYLDRT